MEGQELKLLPFFILRKEEPMGRRTYTFESLNEGLIFSHFTGSNGAGACTLAGVKVGDQVVGVLQLSTPDDDSADFESVISVDGQIQQTSATDHSLNEFAVLVVKRN